jgi:ankyrin repeat protein
MFEDIKNGDIESAKLAIANGSDVNAKDKFGATPLDSAVCDEH